MVQQAHNRYCPMVALKQKEKEEAWHGLCTEEHCAWWTGEECAILTVARVMGKAFPEKKQK